MPINYEPLSQNSEICPMKYTDATAAEVNEAMQRSWKAFRSYRKLTLKQRADFLRKIAVEN